MPDQSQDQTKRPAERVGSPAGSAGEQTTVSSKVERKIEEIENAAVEQARNARLRARSGAEQQRERAAARIERVGDVLVEAGAELIDTDELSGHYLGLAGSKIADAAAYVREVTPQALREDVRRFAHERPFLFYGGAFALGLGLARFFHSSGAGEARGYGRGESQLGAREAIRPPPPPAQEAPPDDGRGSVAGGSSGVVDPRAPHSPRREP